MMPLAKMEEWRKRRVSAVFDSSPLIYLTRIGILDDILKIYNEVCIPEAIKKEVVDRGVTLCKPDAFILDEYVKNGRIKVCKIKDFKSCTILSKNPLIHKVDVEAICLAEKLDSILVMDDPKAIEAAKLRGITVEPTLTVVLICYALDFIDFESAERSYRSLLKTQFRVKANVYDRALQLLEMVRNIKVNEYLQKK